MEYIIIPVVVLLALLTIGLYFRRKHSAIIARLDQEKMQIQHYPLYEELTKIKALNMNGQTEELFENWRTSWAEVMDVHITKIDALLFDAEEYIDRFKFKKASVVQQEIEEKIAQCDQTRLRILSELEELIGSEEKNRIEVDQLRDYYRQARKTVLAHQHSFGPALKALEERIEAFGPKFEEFDEMTNSGNYMQARETVLSLNAEAQDIFNYLSEIPTLLSDIQTKIPTAIHDLRGGVREMEEQHYYLQHLELTTYLNNVEAELEVLKENISKLEIQSVKDRITEINGEIDQYYDLLEKEVLARNFVDKNLLSTREALYKVMVVARELCDEAEYVQHSYRLTDQEADVPKVCLKQLEVAKKKFDLVEMRSMEQKSAYSSLEEELVDIQNEVEHVQETLESFSGRLKNLRIDENKARANLEQMRRKLQNLERQLQRANMPGIPEEMEVRLEEVDEQLFIVTQSLQEVPLNMEQVHSNLASARRYLEDVTERVEEMILNVLLIERMIQYGNRYRAGNPQMHAQLLEAEEAFLQCRYMKALEDAGAAIESVEPGALKKIEAIVEEELAVKS